MEYPLNGVIKTTSYKNVLCQQVLFQTKWTLQHHRDISKRRTATITSCSKKQQPSNNTTISKHILEIQGKYYDKLALKWCCKISSTLLKYRKKMHVVTLRKIWDHYIPQSRRIIELFSKLVSKFQVPNTIIQTSICSAVMNLRND